MSNSPRCGYTGDGGSATSAELYYPYGVAVDSKGSVYIADYQETVVRKSDEWNHHHDRRHRRTRRVTRATEARPPTPCCISRGRVAVDPAGNVFIADTSNCRVREINAATGIITTVAGTGNCTFTGDGLATSNGIWLPAGHRGRRQRQPVHQRLQQTRTLGESERDHDHDRGHRRCGYNGDGGLATTGDAVRTHRNRSRSVGRHSGFGLQQLPSAEHLGVPCAGHQHRQPGVRADRRGIHELAADAYCERLWSCNHQQHLNQRELQRGGRLPGEPDQRHALARCTCTLCRRLREISTAT